MRYSEGSHQLACDTDRSVLLDSGPLALNPQVRLTLSPGLIAFSFSVIDPAPHPTARRLRHRHRRGNGPHVRARDRGRPQVLGQER